MRRRAIPLAGAVVLLGVFMGASLWILPQMHHLRGWSYDMDIWNCFFLAHLADTGAYQTIYGRSPFFGTPGIVVALAPVWWVAHAAGMSAPYLFPMWRPTAWLVVGPYEVLLSSSVLFAVDAIALRLGASTSRRLLICALEVYALYNVVLWGHPELAVAVAFLLYAYLAASEERWSRCGWLIGAAVAFQPVVLLALPSLLLRVGWKRMSSLLVRGAAPAAVLLVLPLVMDWSVTVYAFIHQGNYPSLNRPTPWLRFAPSLGHQFQIGVGTVAVVADGPYRLLAILFSFLLGFLFRRGARQLAMTCAVVALALSLWCAFASVIAPYYVWPTIAVTLISLSIASRLRSTAVITLAIVAGSASNADLHAEWVWWVIVVALAALVASSWPARTTRDSAKEPSAVEASPLQVDLHLAVQTVKGPQQPD